VGFGGEPLSVPDQTIILIQRRLEGLNKRLRQPQPQFKPGDVVRITNGPLADMAALFE
jgi:transcription antitermination factor NusG